MRNFYNDVMDEVYEQSKRDIQVEAKQALWHALAALPVPDIPMLLHCQPLPWENLESLMYRVAERNALGSISGLKRALLLPDGKPLSKKRLQQLSACTGGTFDALAPMVPTDMGKDMVALGHHHLPSRHLALTTSRLCPHCVAEHGYGKLYWNLAPFAVCEEHGVYLIDKCTCTPDARLNSARPGYAVCRCGSKLTRIKTCSATPAAQALSGEIVRLFKREPEATNISLQPTIKLPADLDLIRLLDMVVFLGCIHRDPKTMALQLYRARVSMNTVADQFETAAVALVNWPHGLFTLLRDVRRFSSAPLSYRSVAASLDHVMNAAVKYLRPELSTLFLAGYGAFLNSPDAWNHPASQNLETVEE